MKITAKVLNEADMKRTIKRFGRLTQKGIEAGVKELAKSTGKALAHKVQPFGLSAKKGAKYIDNIGEEVDHVRYGVNVGAYPANNIEAAHNHMRRYGNIKIRHVSGKGWKNIISKGESERYKRRKQANAGMAKAGWIEAGNQASGKNMARIPSWIRRHLGGGLGRGRIIRAGARTTAELSNSVSYIGYTQKNKDVRSALAMGRRNGLKHMMEQIDKHTSKVG